MGKQVTLTPELFFNYFRQVPKPIKIVQLDSYPTFRVIVQRESQKTRIEGIVKHIAGQRFKCNVIVQ